MDYSPVVELGDANLSELSGNFEVHHSPIMFQILSEGLYARKIEAVVREYITNAVDIHVRHNIPTQQIQVTLRGDSDIKELVGSQGTRWAIRDYGPGMSEEEVRSRYIVHGGSDKFQRNNEVGELGLGCKSGFAYASSFHVTSYYDGVRTDYVARKVATGFQELVVMGRRPTTETGMCISIPVNNMDTTKFEDCTLLIASSLFYPITFDNRVTEPSPYNQAGVYPLLDSNTRLRKFLSINGVCYKINEYELQDTFLRQVMPYVHIVAAKGEVTYTPSRESLVYDPKTVQYITNTLQTYLIKTLEDQLNILTAQTPSDIEDAFCIIRKQIFSSIFDKFTLYNYPDYLLILIRKSLPQMSKVMQKAIKLIFRYNTLYYGRILQRLCSKCGAISNFPETGLPRRVVVYSKLSQVKRAKHTAMQCSGELPALIRAIFRREGIDYQYYDDVSANIPVYDIIGTRVYLHNLDYKPTILALPISKFNQGLRRLIKEYVRYNRIKGDCLYTAYRNEKDLSNIKKLPNVFTLEERANYLNNKYGKLLYYIEYFHQYLIKDQFKHLSYFAEAYALKEALHQDEVEQNNILDVIYTEYRDYERGRRFSDNYIAKKDIYLRPPADFVRYPGLVSRNLANVSGIDVTDQKIDRLLKFFDKLQQEQTTTL